MKAGKKAREICRKKFLYYFPKGFQDPKYISWERGYKWDAHLAWEQNLPKQEYKTLLKNKSYADIALRAVKVETRTNLLFSFEKMALRDGIKTSEGSQIFAEGLYNYIYGKGSMPQRFEDFTRALDMLPRKQTRVRTWPLQTVFGFIACPGEHIFLKPRVTKEAARKYDYAVLYKSTPNWESYESVLNFASEIRKDNADLHPRDLMDIQSFMWVLGSEEYPD